MASIATTAIQAIKYALSGDFMKAKQAYKELKAQTIALFSTKAKSDNVKHTSTKEKAAKGKTLKPVKPSGLPDFNSSTKEHKEKRSLTKGKANNKGKVSSTPASGGGVVTNKQTKSITVNIKSFIEKMNVSSDNMQTMNPDDLESMLNDMFLRITRNVETSN